MVSGEPSKMSTQSSFYETYKKNKIVFLSVLLLPMAGMIAVIPIVLLRAPKNKLLVVALTFFLIIQYAVTIFFLIKKIEHLHEKPPVVQSEP
ncbi:hypothetical protein CL673_08915 [Candidatus Bathyarchaeota archaeon]|nr:hypothetical protein [Candidatus Bathyarchaeota archaeon]